MMRRSIVPLVLSIGASTLMGCTSFTTVRSAELRPGMSMTVQASIASPPGDAAAWIWSVDCEQNCNHAVPGGDVALAYVPRMSAVRPFSLGLGLNGSTPYVEGYVQLDTAAHRPFGIGARLGVPFLSGEMQHQLYARVDWPLGPGRRLLYNPGIVYDTWHSVPNGTNMATFLGITQGLGLQLGAGRTLLIPSAALVWGHASYDNGFGRVGPENRIFGTLAISVVFRGDK